MISKNINDINLAQFLESNKTENKNLDYKERFNWDENHKEEKLKIIKDILAMSNTHNGGKIIFGIKDNNNFEILGLSDEDMKSFDQTAVNNLLHEYSDPLLTCSVHRHNIKGKNIAVIIVPEFLEIPIICKKDGNSSDGKHILQRGQIYIRTDKAESTTISSSEVMREFLGRAISRKSDELLNNIARLLNGKITKSNEYNTSSEEIYKKFLKDTDEKLEFNFASNVPYWEIYVFPSYYMENIVEKSLIKKIIKDSKVIVNYFPFPYSPDNDSDFVNINNGILYRKTSPSFKDLFEGFIANVNGFFAWKGNMFLPNEPEKVEETFTGTIIIFITSFFLFLKRYFDNIYSNKLEASNELIINISLKNSNNLKLIDNIKGFHIIGLRNTTSESIINIKKEIDVVKLKASYKEEAIDVIREIFWPYGLETSEPDIENIQKVFPV